MHQKTTAFENIATGHATLKKSASLDSNWGSSLSNKILCSLVLDEVGTVEKLSLRILHDVARFDAGSVPPSRGTAGGGTPGQGRPHLLLLGKGLVLHSSNQCTHLIATLTLLGHDVKKQQL